MLEGGFVRIFRSILNWEWYTDTNTKTVFLHLILTANWESKKWRGIAVQRGQRVFSYSKLAKELHFSVQSTRTAINHLKSTGEITCDGTSEYSIVTIKNYEFYQSPTCESTNEQQAANKPSTSDQQQLKKDKESNKAKDPPIAPQGGDEDFQGESLPVQTAAGTEKSADHSKTLEDRFKHFWEAYPKKVGKGAAERSFKKYKPDENLLAVMLAALELQRRSDQWQRDGGQFIPNPATWLNQKRWEDEAGPPQKQESQFSDDLDAFEKSGVFDDFNRSQ